MAKTKTIDPAKTEKKTTPEEEKKKQMLELAIQSIKKSHGESAVMFMNQRLAEDVPVIPTGIPSLDRCLGIGGLPKGRIIELFGPEGSGKTTVALHAVAECQKQGGVAAIIDVEHALSISLVKSIGIEVDKLLISQPDSAEQALDILRQFISSGVVDCVVVDSVAALTPEAEFSGKIGETQIGIQARLMSVSLRQISTLAAKTGCTVIFINQLRQKINMGYAPGGPQETTTGGRALKFYSSVRIEVKRGKSISKGDLVTGHELFMKVVKNKLYPPFRSCVESLVYGKGVPYSISILNMAIATGVVKKKGSWFEYKGETLGQGLEKVADFIESNPSLMEEIRGKALGVDGEQDMDDTSDPDNILSRLSNSEEDDEDDLEGIPFEISETILEEDSE